MTRKAKSSPTVVPDSRPGPSSHHVSWKFTKSMNMRDLSRDDDYLSHLFVEKLGNLGSTAPFLVHKMDPMRRLPRTDAMEILTIVHRVCPPHIFSRMARGCLQTLPLCSSFALSPMDPWPSNRRSTSYFRMSFPRHVPNASTRAHAPTISQPSSCPALH